MLLLECPWCGGRNASEFAYAGEPMPRPDPESAGPAEWRGYLYLRANRCGWTRERWYHRAGCRRFFEIERNTQTHELRPVGGGAGGPDE
ncbi:MAG: sarcosine oxidase subunit delta [Propionibacteriales bacterium]|nr:sarcosine oxidase subunit delta [Propionibacteriales bacterium]